MQALSVPTFEMLQVADGMRNNPDIVDDLHRLAGKFVFLRLLLAYVVYQILVTGTRSRSIVHRQPL